MNKTEHYNLNQWQRHDRVLMDDFNADNAKIDAALAKHDAAITAEASARQTAVAAAEGKISWVKLLDMTTSANAAQVDIDVSKLNLTKYQELQLFFKSPAHTAPCGLRLLCNGETTGYYFDDRPSSSLSSLTTETGFQKITLFLGNCVSAMMIYCNYDATGAKPKHAATDYGTEPTGWHKAPSALKTLNIAVGTPGELYIAKGSRIYLYGLKK